MPETLTIAQLMQQGALSFGDGYRTKKSEHGQPGLPILRVAEVHNGSIRPEFSDYVSDSYRGAMGAKVSQPGDIVLTTKGTVGRVAVIPDDSPPFVYSPQVCYFRVSESGALDRRFLYYWFKGAEFWSQAGHRKSQTDMADYLNMADIRSLCITIPDRSQQKSIARILGALDDKISINERIATTAESLSITLASGESRRESIRLDEICTLRKVQMVPQELTDDAVDHYSLPAFDASKLPDRVSPESIKSSKFTVSESAVLLSKLNPDIPRVWNVEPSPDVPSLASTEFLVLVPRGPLTTHELWAVTSQRSFLDELASKVTGTSKSHQRVRPAEVMATEVVDPRQFGDTGQQIRSLARRAALARQESQALATLRDTLLPQLMSGRLRVKDAEKIVEDHV
ncbi:restriction endonuclease subunit S [Kitasatospora sp. NPDC093679]|uniref:restriction endonuclease subunit S n=1 Tax=Kitasatospora sp. NPDC093679 TaxID=3154983 RepID=UPI003413C76A